MSEAVNEAVRESMESLRDWDFDMDRDVRMHRKGRVRDLMREWRDAVRSAEDSNDWEAADDLARELTRAASGLNVTTRLPRHAPRGSTRS